MLSHLLANLGSRYGALPAHDGLWQSSKDTAHDLAARLAVVPLVLEARGLDVTPAMISNLRRFGDDAAADALQIIHDDEITHVAAGRRWFEHVCAEKQPCLFDVVQKLVWDMRVVARRAAENAAGGASTLLTRVQHRARDRQGRASRAAARCPMGILDRPCARRLSEARSGRRDGLADRTKGWARTEPSCRRPALCVIEPEAQAGSSFQV
jgi:Protein of unknown function (DUF455)